MARGSIRRRFLVSSIASTLLALVLFAAGSLAIVWIDDADADMALGDSFTSEAVELILGATERAAARGRHPRSPRDDGPRPPAQLAGPRG